MSKQIPGPDKAEHKNSTRILIGLLIGAAIGGLFNVLGPSVWRDFLLENLIQPIGSAFLQSLFMVVVPLVFSSLIVGVTNLGSVKNIGRLGGRLVSFYLLTTLCAILIGQALITVVAPGEGLDRALAEQATVSMTDQLSQLEEKSSMVGKSLWPGLVTTIIPRNIITALGEANMLAIIFVSILFGVAILNIESQKAAESLISSLQAVSEVCIKIVGWIMKVAPIAVAALMIGAVTHFGFELMGNVLQYVLVVVLGYCLQIFGVYALLVKFLIRIPMKQFYTRMLPVFATSFSTSSSSATMPTSMQTLEKNFGVPKNLTTFSIPLGMTVNMDGTALFEVIAALFIAQVFGVEISLMGQISLVVLVLLTSIGVAGVPGGSIPILMSAMATLGIPPLGIALILGVDRLLDMGRTVVNVTGDCVATLYLARVEKVDLEEHFRKHPNV